MYLDAQWEKGEQFVPRNEFIYFWSLKFYYLVQNIITENSKKNDHFGAKRMIKNTVESLLLRVPRYLHAFLNFPVQLSRFHCLYV